MEARAKLLGHAIHPMLIPFPLGLLATAALFDVLYLVVGANGLAVAAFAVIAVGVITGVLAGIFGLIDWLAVPAGTRAKRLGAIHGLGNLAVVVLFAVSWLLRLGGDGVEPSIPAVVLSIVAALIAAVTAWQGGELVERLGVGVDQGANVDAPSSLSSR